MKIKVNDIVQIKFGSGYGKIGVRGRNLYRIVINMDGDNPINIELPKEEFTFLAHNQ